MNVNSEVSDLKGVGPKLKESLNELGIYTIKDLLLYFPRDYDYINNLSEGNGEEGSCLVEGIVTRIDRDFRTKNGKLISTIQIKIGEKHLLCKWFNQPYMKNSFKVGIQYKLVGRLNSFNGSQVLLNPKISRDIEAEKGIMPKYPAIKAVTSNMLGKLIKQVLLSTRISENLPEYLIKKYDLIGLDEALRNIHIPMDREKLEKARRRLKFQELFAYSLKILMLKKFSKSNNNGIIYKMSSELVELKDSLPFELTNAQRKAVKEILLDQKSAYSMNRLLQGDVGSGKTIVALIALFNVIKNGYQAALMAPTEILANQHFSEAVKILEKFNVNIGLLVGSLSQKAKLKMKEDIKNGSVDLVIGTHALIEDNVEFHKLGMIVTDEQHRFGVYQRAKLLSKGNNIDVLVMSATPIPRTLSLFIYGDLDISVMDELPPGRQKIETFLVEQKKREKAYMKVLEEIRKGRQAYIVCPIIEDSETMQLQSVKSLYDKLKENYFKDINIALLHGKMNAGEKEEIMTSFKKGDIKVLISTTVIEVGVNVPNSSVMVIENAERFGLSQLHQLRGRVGRGEYKSYCILIADIKNDNTKRRMSIMTETNDGFKIAEEDMKLRGSGDLFGVNQSGDAGLMLADIFSDIDLLRAANLEAKNVLENEELFRDIINELRLSMENSAKFICFN